MSTLLRQLGHQAKRLLMLSVALFAELALLVKLPDELRLVLEHRFQIVRKNEAYPVFTTATSNNKPPWPGDVKSTLTGQVNGFFRWRNFSDTKN